MSAFTVIITSRGWPVYSGDAETWPTPQSGQSVVPGYPPADNAYWNGSNWVVPAYDVQGARNRKWAQIKTQRQIEEFSPFTWDSSTFDADEAAQRRLIGASTASLAADVRWLATCVQTLAQDAGVTLPARPTMAVPWTLADNSVRTLDEDDVVNAGLALLQRVAAIFTQAEARRQAILAATTKEQIDAVTW